MISRYSLSADATAVSDRYSADPTPGYEPMYNAAPTLLLPVMTQESPNGMSFFYWGATPAFAGQKPLGERIINTHAEAIAEKQALRRKLRDHRCLIPADGFYLWKRIGRKALVPYRFTLPGNSLFAIAGIWEEYEDENNISHHTFSMITRQAHPSLSEYAERIPAILLQEKESSWLKESDTDALTKLLADFPGEFQHYPVSTRINDPKQNTRSLILPVPAADQFGNLTLFD